MQGRTRPEQLTEVHGKVATVDKSAKLASATVKAKRTENKAKGTVKETTTTTTTLGAAMLREGRAIWQAWIKGKTYVSLGIREKTALGLKDGKMQGGTRSAMLAVAAHGYKQGEGRLLAQAVRAAQGLNPNVGGIDFPWLEKTKNIEDITSSARVRLASDGKMRLLPIVVSKADRAAKAARKTKASKPDTARTNGSVTTRKMSEAELAELQAE